MLKFLTTLAATPNKILFSYHQQPISAATFLHAVNTFSQQIAASPYQRIALGYQDSYLFSIALFAIFKANRQPILLPNLQPGTLANFSAEYDIILNNLTLPNTTCHQAHPASAQTIILFTSGSSGQPKKIQHTIASLEQEIQTLESIFGEKLQQTPFYATVSHQHLYGLIFYILWPLLAGRVIHVPILTYPEQLLHHPKQPMVWVTSAAMLKRLVREPNSPPLDLSASLTIFTSGGLLEKTVADKIYHLLNVYPIEIFGSTETGGVGYRQQNQDWTLFRHASPLLDEIQITTPSHFKLLERKDRIVKVEEKRVSLVEIENHLKQQTYINDAYALLLNEKRQVIGAVICLNTAGKALLNQQGKLFMNRLLSEYLAPYFDPITLPKRFRYIDELPYNAQGKLILSNMKAFFPQEVTLPLHVPENFIYFAGHFPDTPVLAGVAQLNWVLDLVQENFNISKATFLKIEQLKFMQVILPNQSLYLNIKIKDKSLKFKYFDDKAVHSTGKLSRELNPA